MKIFPTTYILWGRRAFDSSLPRDNCKSAKVSVDALAKRIYQIFLALGTLLRHYFSNEKSASTPSEERRKRPTTITPPNSVQSCSTTPERDDSLKFDENGSPLSIKSRVESDSVLIPPRQFNGANKGRADRQGFTTPPRRIISPSSSASSSPQKLKCCQTLTPQKRREIETSVRQLFQESATADLPRVQNQEVPKQIVFNGWDELLEWNCDRL